MYQAFCLIDLCSIEGLRTVQGLNVTSEIISLRKQCVILLRKKNLVYVALRHQLMQGFALLGILNAIGVLAKLSLGLNVFNALVIAVLGIPGLALLILLRLIFI